MGSSAIGDLAIREEVTPDKLHGSTVAVDAYNWIHKYLYPTKMRFQNADDYTTSDGRELVNIPAALRSLPRLLESDMTPVMVFDGDAHALKAEEQQARREIKEQRRAAAEEAREQGDYKRARRLEAQGLGFSPEMVQTTKELFDHLGVPTFVAPSAGEAQAAYMVQNHDVDYALSEDYDTLLFGSLVTVRNFTGKGVPEVMNLDSTVQDTGLYHPQLVDVAILCGTDYNDGIHGIGPVRATNLIAEHGNVHDALADIDEEIQNVDELRDIFLNPSVSHDYEVPESWDPDLAAAEQYVMDDLGLTDDKVVEEFQRIQDRL